jgi:hypothetical protein
MKIALATAAAALFLLSGAPLASAQGAKGITSYKEIVDVARDGSAKVTLTVTAAEWPDTIERPLDVPGAKNITAEAGGAAATAEPVKVGDVNRMKVHFDRPPSAGVPLTISYAADKFIDWTKAKPKRGIYTLSRTFTNATTTDIKNYEMHLLLPPGYTMNGVTSSTPRAKESDVVPPYDFTTEDSRLAVTLRSKSVAAGGTAAIAFGFASSERNPWPIVLVGLALALLGLYVKRDVLTRPDYVREVVA